MINVVNPENVERMCFLNKAQEAQGKKELLLLVYEKADENGIRCKVRIKPRHFKELCISNVQDLRLYYWNNEMGASMFLPKYKVNKGVYVLDEEENCQMVQEALKEKQISAEEQQEILQIQSLFTIDRGYVYRECLKEDIVYTERLDSSCDWSSVYYKAFFKKNSFFIEDREVFSIYVQCHFTTDEEQAKLRGLLKVRKWTMEDVYELIKVGDTYDWVFQCWYYDKEGKLELLLLNYDDHKLRFNDGKSMEEQVVEAFGIH